jgi:microcystin-dependent protein
MSQQYLGEVRPVPYNFAPRGWAFCDGQILAISQNAALFSLLGTNFGGNGTSTFGLPNLQGNVAIHAGQGPGLSQYVIGETGGTPNVTLLQAELAQHGHGAVGESGRIASTSASPAGNGWGKAPANDTPYSTSATNARMSPNSTTPTGGNLPHNNLMPYLAINFIIALQGVFPARN